MFEHDTLQKTNEFAKAALQRLEFLGLPPSPDYFALMYAYVSGRVPDIKAAVDEAVRKGGLNIEKAKELYQKHLGIASEKQELEAHVKSLSDELNRVVDIISQANTGAGRLNETLNTFSGELNKPLTVEELRSKVSRVAQETKLIADENQKLQSKLAESTQQLSSMREDLDRAQKESLTDMLTGVGNRKHFVNELKRLVVEAEEQDARLSLLMIDIDFFKKFNDQHGHLVGDQVLKLVGKALTENLKGRDVIARYGGEEFVIILPQTRLTDATKVAEALRMSVSAKKIIRRDTNQTLGGVTVSAGVAQYQKGEKLSDLVRRADVGLYLAKAAGRNRVVAQEVDANALYKTKEGKDDAARFDELDS